MKALYLFSIVDEILFCLSAITVRNILFSMSMFTFFHGSKETSKTMMIYIKRYVVIRIVRALLSINRGTGVCRWGGVKSPPMSIKLQESWSSSKGFNVHLRNLT